MMLFCFLWVLLFYLLRRSTEENISSGGVWALLLGSIIALVQFFLGDLIAPGGFGFSRWLSGLVDIVAVPALIPLFIYFLIANFKIISGTANFTNFALLWLIPGAGIRAVSWSSLSDPILLVLVPILWTAIAVGIPFFISLILESKRWVAFPASLAMLCLPLAAASSYWAFYTQKTLMGALFLAASVSPMLLSTVLALVKTGDS